MIQPHIRDDNEALIAYLYDECDAAERRRIDHHLAECEHCVSEIREMRSVRDALGGWTPPVAKLGFRIVQDPPRSVWRWASGPLPAWAQVAAAVFLFAAGAAVARLDVRYGADGLTVRSGWGRLAGTFVQTSPAAVQPGPMAARSSEPGGVETRSPAQTTVSATTGQGDLTPRGGNATSAAQIDDALLRRVQAMIAQSEQKQQQELALRVTQVVRDMDAQHRADLLRVEQNFGELEGQTGAAVAQQSELLNYLVRVSQQQPQR